MQYVMYRRLGALLLAPSQDKFERLNNRCCMAADA
jgi:hypothetical protein